MAAARRIKALVRTLRSLASRNGFSGCAGVFHTFSSVALNRERETPPRTERRPWHAFRREKHLRGEPINIGWREEARAVAIEHHKIAIPRGDLRACEEHDDLRIAWVLRDVCRDVRSSGFYLNEEHAVAALRATVRVCLLVMPREASSAIPSRVSVRNLHLSPRCRHCIKARESSLD